MMKTIEPFMGPAFVVTRREVVHGHGTEHTEMLYAEAHPAWVRGTGGWVWPWRTLSEGIQSLEDRYGTGHYCRWYDALDDATWFVDQADAAALALLVDGAVIEVGASDDEFAEAP